MREQSGRLVVAVIASVFVLAGVLGLARGAAFTVDSLSPVVHLGFGLIGLAVARSARGSRWFLIGGGVLYVLWHYGALTVLTPGSAGTLDTANHWLNFWFAASMIALACVVGERSRPVSDPRELPDDERSVPLRRDRPPVSGPGARPRRPRPAAGNRPRLAGAVGR